ncbi:hypothetical protein L798_02468 [Zootermopsis nevadensis]|uniref:Uncharacterized protein n=1 Tax=Zootermopsis nevadensis TaxID=136037 RepID=A0A067QRD7_ZOONE|nr:hypothetical protein L798_02468 [Zootermopsis nevadensis]
MHRVSVGLVILGRFRKSDPQGVPYKELLHYFWSIGFPHTQLTPLFTRRVLLGVSKSHNTEHKTLIRGSLDASNTLFEHNFFLNTTNIYKLMCGPHKSVSQTLMDIRSSKSQ